MQKPLVLPRERLLLLDCNINFMTPRCCQQFGATYEKPHNFVDLRCYYGFFGKRSLRQSLHAAGDLTGSAVSIHVRVLCALPAIGGSCCNSDTVFLDVTIVET